MRDSFTTTLETRLSGHANVAVLRAVTKFCCLIKALIKICPVCPGARVIHAIKRFDPEIAAGNVSVKVILFKGTFPVFA